jgi:hypothetical protein
MRLAGALAVGLLAAPAADAATWHVDGTGHGGAWKGFAAIDWATIRPGDRIAIAGGQSYAGPLDVETDGAPGNPVVIEADGKGEVVIDGGNRLEVCVRLDGSDHVTVRGLSVRDCTDAAFRIRNATGIVAERNTIHAPARAFHVWRTSEVTIADNRVTTPDHVELQTDGIYSQENRRNRYERNHIVISNGEPEGHDDGIQSYKDADLTIAGNYIEQRNAKTGNAQGIFITDATGRMTVVNNLVYAPNTRNGLVTLLNQSGTDGALDAFHNTLVGSQWGVIQLENAAGSRILDNILYSTTRNAAGITLAGAFPPPAHIDHNLYFVPNGAPGYVADGATHSWEEWRGLGFERHGVAADPLLPDPVTRRFTPAWGSPAIDAASPLALVTRDHAGRPRPLGRGPDIGAFEVR